jgi:hypothetical protein
LHLLCRALRKGQRQDLFGFGTLFSDEPSHASCDDLGLSSAGSRDDEEGPLTVCDGGVLLVVEVINKVCDRRSWCRGTLWCYP